MLCGRLSQVFSGWTSELSHGILNHRIAEIVGNLWRSVSPSHLLKAGLSLLLKPFHWVFSRTDKISCDSSPVPALSASTN